MFFSGTPCSHSHTFKPQSDLFTTEQLHCSCWVIGALLKGTSAVVTREGPVVLFHFPDPDVSFISPLPGLLLHCKTCLHYSSFKLKQLMYKAIVRHPLRWWHYLQCINSRDGRVRHFLYLYLYLFNKLNYLYLYSH